LLFISQNKKYSDTQQKRRQTSRLRFCVITKRKKAFLGNTAQRMPDGFVAHLLEYFPSFCTEIS
jgi:uncharacterized FAD-dependent dehydrogenase